MAKTRIDFILPSAEEERYWIVLHDKPLVVNADGLVFEQGEDSNLAHFPPGTAVVLRPLGATIQQIAGVEHGPALDRAKLRAEVEHETACKIADWLGNFVLSRWGRDLADKIRSGDYR